jgi:phosphoglycerol transferase MdoB-like AlkP superfamily enzyme
MYLILRRITSLLICYTVLRFIFWQYNFAFFPSTFSIKELLYYFFAALRFDASAIFYVNGLYLFLEVITFFAQQKWLYNLKKILFFIPNFVVLALEIADIFLFQFQSRRVVFADSVLIHNTLAMLPTFIFRYWYASFAGLLFFAIAWYWDGRMWNKNIPLTKEDSLNLFKKILFVSFSTLLLVGLVIVIGRGGLQRRPINNLTAAVYVDDAKWIPFVLNSTFSLLSTSQRKAVVEPPYFDQPTLDSLYTLHRHYQQPEPFRPLNVVVLVMESFGKEYSSKYNDYQGAMPFLDSLSNYGFSTKKSFANAIRSSYGIVAVSAGIPTLMEDAFMFSPYQNNRVASLAALLQPKGYTSAFFHGSVAGSMAFDRYAKSIGYNVFEDMTHYPNQKDFDGQWGIFDRPYFQYVASRLNQLPQPFHSLVFSLSSHEPYKVEADFEKKYAAMQPLERSVLYADDALRRFFQKAQQMPWFENTLFVITADHTGASSHKQYQTAYGKFEIPIIFYHPKGNLKGMANKVSQQIDILPSILDYLHYDKPFTAFGQSLFNDKIANYAFMYFYGRYFILDTQYILGVDEGKPVIFYDYQKDPLQKNNLIGKMPIKEHAMLIALLARIQRHHKAMIHNELSSSN